MSLEKKSKHILILGGMGPQASVYAHSLLIQAATRNGAVENEDYPRVTHLSVNVRDFIGTPAHRQAACDYLVRCIKEIDASTVDAAFIACNTAHMLREELEAATGLTFTSLIGTTVEYMQSSGKVEAVGILATPSTLNTGIYGRRIGEVARLIEPTLESSHAVEAIIRGVISGSDEQQLLEQLRTEVQSLIDNGAQKVILGCTELSLLGAHLDKGIVIDPLLLTVEKVLRND